MRVETRKATVEALTEYGEVPISIEVRSVFRVVPMDGGGGGLGLREEPLDEPYVKDYDTQASEGPRRWLRRFDMSDWGIFLAFDDERHLGGAVVAPGSALHDLPDDFAQLFDIRVRPGVRRRGIGTLLLRHAAEWACERGCRILKIESQNINVPACRFYAAQGCTLGTIDRYAYAAFPACAHETRLVWYMTL